MKSFLGPLLVLLWAIMPLDARGADSSALEARVAQYADSLIKRYDRNGNGALEADESKELRGGLREADANGDGVITRAEIIAKLLGKSAPSTGGAGGTSASRASGEPTAPRVMSFGGTSSSSGASGSSTHPGGGLSTGAGTAAPPGSPSGNQASGAAASTSSSPSPATSSGSPAPGAESKSAGDGAKPSPAAKRPLRFLTPHERLPQGLPEWFKSKDSNADGQVTLAEFSATLTEEAAKEFTEYDLNNDGVVTAAEVLKRQKLGRKP